MSTVREAYNPEKIEQIRKLLETQIRKGLPVQFEIYMDSFKVVPKTNDINEFDSYEDYLSSGTRNMRLLIYDSISGTEQVNECFYKMSNYLNSSSSNNNGLSGVDIDERINEQVNSKLADIEFKRELKETKQQLKEAEETIDDLNSQLEAEKAKKGIEIQRWGQVGSVAIQELIKRNPQILSIIPGGESLAGLFTDQPELPKETKTEPQPQATFKEKGEPEQRFSQRELMFHALFNELEKSFETDREGLIKVNFVLNELIKNPSLVHDVAELLKEGNSEVTNQNEEEHIPDHA